MGTAVNRCRENQILRCALLINPHANLPPKHGFGGRRIKCLFLPSITEARVEM